MEINQAIEEWLELCPCDDLVVKELIQSRFNADNIESELPEVNELDVADTVSMMTGIPISKINQKESEKLGDFNDYEYNVDGQLRTVTKSSNIDINTPQRCRNVWETQFK